MGSPGCPPGTGHSPRKPLSITQQDARAAGVPGHRGEGADGSGRSPAGRTRELNLAGIGRPGDPLPSAQACPGETLRSPSETSPPAPCPPGAPCRCWVWAPRWPRGEARFVSAGTCSRPFQGAGEGVGDTPGSCRVCQAAPAPRRPGTGRTGREICRGGCRTGDSLASLCGQRARRGHTPQPLQSTGTLRAQSPAVKKRP